MQRVLILVDFYYPKPLANGVCVNEIAEEFTRQGYEVDIVCYGSKNVNSEISKKKYINIHFVKQRFFHRLRSYGESNMNSKFGRLVYKAAILINRIKKIIYLPLYPMTSIIHTLRYYSKSKKIFLEKRHDIIISVFNPLEALITGCLLKKINDDTKLILYVLDSLTNGAKRIVLPKSWTEKKGWQWEKRAYNRADLILNMKTHEKHHKKNRYDMFRCKMKFVDIPLYTNRSSYELISLKPTINEIHDTNKINFVYSGGLTLNDRNPEYTCKLLLSLKNEVDFKLDFYSRGNAENLLKYYQDVSDGIIERHGYIERSLLAEKIAKADILISIGNKNSDMIPSKIFEYMSTGKKIIHVYIKTDDSCLVYFDRYHNVLLINENDKLENNLKKIKKFIQAEKEPTSYVSMKNLFIENTPEFTVNLMKNN